MADVRWEQRFDNYQSALEQLNQAIQLSSQRALSDLEKQGMIQGFEYTYELAWKTLKDMLEYRGQTQILGAKDAFRKAFSLDLVADGAVWMDMIQSRNQTAHAYNQKVAEEIVDMIVGKYIHEFNELRTLLASQLGS